MLSLILIFFKKHFYFHIIFRIYISVRRSDTLYMKGYDKMK